MNNQTFTRLLNTDDFNEFYCLIKENKNRLKDFFAGLLSKTNSLEKTMNYCNRVEVEIENKTYFPYLILDSVSSKMIGFIDIKNIDWNIPKAEIGAFIDAKYEGRGLVAENIMKIIETIVSQHKFKKLYCRVSSENIRSINLVIKSGFQLEGTLRRDYKTTSGKIIDLNYYGKLF